MACRMWSMHSTIIKRADQVKRTSRGMYSDRRWLRALSRGRGSKRALKPCPRVVRVRKGGTLKSMRTR
eukprot:7377304-Prymnesium_polylepis.2